MFIENYIILLQSISWLRFLMLIENDYIFDFYYGSEGGDINNYCEDFFDWMIEFDF